MDAFYVLAGIYIFLLGSCIGSFLNVLVYRIPAGIPFWKGRSYCPHCHTAIKPYDMVPVLNWFYLKGKCRNCKSPISPRYSLVEAAGGILAVWCFAVYRGNLWQPLLTFAVAALLLTIALIDLDTMEIPDGLIISLGVCALASIWVFPEATLMQKCIGAFCVSAPMFLVCLLIPDAFGGGDVKLLAVMGFYLGWKVCLVGAFLGIMFGGVQAVYLLVTKKVKRGEGAHMAFGPALCAGIFLAQLYGAQIFQWYAGLLI